MGRALLCKWTMCWTPPHGSGSRSVLFQLPDGASAPLQYTAGHSKAGASGHDPTCAEVYSMILSLPGGSQVAQPTIPKGPGFSPQRTRTGSICRMASEPSLAEKFRQPGPNSCASQDHCGILECIGLWQAPDLSPVTASQEVQRPSLPSGGVLTHIGPPEECQAVLVCLDKKQQELDGLGIFNIHVNRSSSICISHPPREQVTLGSPHPSKTGRPTLAYLLRVSGKSCLCCPFPIITVGSLMPGSGQPCCVL